MYHHVKNPFLQKVNFVKNVTYEVLSRQRRYAIARYAIARPSVRPSVRHTGRSVKDVEVRIMQPSPQVAA